MKPLTDAEIDQRMANPNKTRKVRVIRGNHRPNEIGEVVERLPIGRGWFVRFRNKDCGFDASELAWED